MLRFAENNENNRPGLINVGLMHSLKPAIFQVTVILLESLIASRIFPTVYLEKYSENIFFSYQQYSAIAIIPTFSRWHNRKLILVKF